MNEPVFAGTPGTMQGIEFFDGPGGKDYIWDAFPTTIFGEGPVNGAPMDAFASVIFTSAGHQVSADGLIATLWSDTTGFATGTSLPLMLARTEIGQDSDFILTGGGTQSATITNGSINLVPEPATIVQLFLLAALGLGFTAVSRRPRE